MPHITLRGRPARRRRDELDDYWKGTIWQRILQDRQMWKQHAEAFALPRTLRLHNDDDDDDICVRVYIYIYTHIYNIYIIDLLTFTREDFVSKCILRKLLLHEK